MTPPAPDAWFAIDMSEYWTLPDLSVRDIGSLAERLGVWLRLGDVVALSGDLGTGKTTFARQLIRGLLAEPDMEVPSPTFSLVQTYNGARGPITHLDLYRLDHPDDAREIGLEEIDEKSFTIVEWPERFDVAAGRPQLTIRFIETTDVQTRTLALTASPAMVPRVERMLAADVFLARNGWGEARVLYLQGDASTRRYARLILPDASAILMDWPRQPDGPVMREGLTYSRIAQLAEDVVPFVAVGRALRAEGLSAPAIFAEDLDGGFLLIEDLGDGVFATETDEAVHQAELWTAAIDMLIKLRRADPPKTMSISGAGSGTYTLPPLDATILGIEVALLPDWYWLEVYDEAMPAAVRAEFDRVWHPVIERLLAQPRGWLLRDVHSPNLLWLPDRTGIERVGVIDFQDALAGPWAYDVMSLLQDARVAVPAALEAQLRQRYLTHAEAISGFDEQAFLFTYAAYGALRATRLLGLFVRLLRRDGKAQYLAHIPRNWDYLERNLRHPELAQLRDWYDNRFPPEVRLRPVRP